MFERKLHRTADGSYTLRIEEWDENYHSGHGALQEAKHVFIEHGLNHIKKDAVSVFEMGFGTGLNALLAMNESIRQGINIYYSGIEAYPVDIDLIRCIGYEQIALEGYNTAFEQMHLVPWGERIQLTSRFSFEKIHNKIEVHEPVSDHFDLIFFDAFGPRAQSDMWDLSVLMKMHKMLKTGGVLVTYCAKGQFKRDLKELGFEIEALPGPPGKREMTRATKIN